MRKPLLGMVTDSHLKKGNEAQIIDIFRQAIERVKELGLHNLYFVGDWFDSRKYQGLSTLKATAIIFKMFAEADIELRIIPGNHDKPDYNSEDSYLDIFEHYPSIRIVRDHACWFEGNVRVHMIPFFDEKKSFGQYLDMAREHVHASHNVLLTHVAVNGVRNNDGSEMEDVVGLSQFTDLFHKTFIGHYHDYQELADGQIIYIGSSHQHNFGEDELKGMTIMYDNLSIEQEKFETKEYKQVIIDLNVVPFEEVEELAKEYGEADDNVRFKFTGVKEKLQAIDKNRFKRSGIDVKVKQDEVDVDLSYTELKEFKGFDANTIIEEWNDFTTRKEVNDEFIKNGKERLVSLLIKKAS